MALYQYLFLYDDFDVSLYGAGNAACSTNPAMSRPYLIHVNETAESTVDFLEGSSTIGQVNIKVLDVRTVATDQATGWFTALLANSGGENQLVGRRITLDCRDAGGTLQYVIFDGVINEISLDADNVTYTIITRDVRDNERAQPLFNLTNGSTSVFPPGVRDGYGKYVRAGGGTALMVPAAPVMGGKYNTLSGINGGQIRLDHSAQSITPEMYHEQYEALNIATARYNNTGTFLGYCYPNVIVRWRDEATHGAWNTLTNMPVLGTTYKNVFETDSQKFVIDASADNLLRLVESSYDLVRLFSDGTGAFPLPANNQRVEVQVLSNLPPSELYPFWWDGNLGQLLKDIYDGLYSYTNPKIRYNAAAMTAFIAAAPNSRIRMTKGVEDMRPWVEENIYKPMGYAPAINQAGEVVPVPMFLPDASVTPITLDNTNCYSAGWKHSSSDSVTKVTWKWKSEAITGPLYRGNWWKPPRPIVTEVKETDREDVYLSASAVYVGTKEVTYEPETFRDIDPPNAFDAAQTNSTARQAQKVGRQLIDRLRYGGQHIVIKGARRSDTGVQALKVGDWVICGFTNLPDYGTHVRGMSRLAQVISIKDVDPISRDMELLDSGPSGAPLSIPTIGTVTVTGQVISVALTAVAGAEVALEYALQAGQPTSGSNLWQRAARGATGTYNLPILPVGVTVWIRARSEAISKRPSAWATAVSTSIGGLAYPYDASLTISTGINLCPNSEALNVGWVPRNSATVTANVATAPDGSSGGDRFNPNGVGGYIAQTIQSNDINGRTFEVSAWLWTPSGTKNVIIGLLKQDDTPVGVTSAFAITATPKRFSIVGTGNTATTSWTMYIQDADGGSYGNFYVWGTDVKEQSFLSEYVKTDSSGPSSGTHAFANWTPNENMLGARVYYAITSFGITPPTTLTTYFDVDASFGIKELGTVFPGDTITIEVEGWTGFTAGAVSGSQGRKILSQTTYALNSESVSRPTVQSIELNAAGQVVVTIEGDERTKSIKAFAKVGSAPTAAEIRTGTNINGRTATFTFGPYVQGNIVYVGAFSYSAINSTGQESVAAGFGQVSYVLPVGVITDLTPFASSISPVSLTSHLIQAVKVSGGAAWNEQIRSLTGLVGGAKVSARAKEYHCMFGLNTDPTTDASYTSIDYAWYTDISNTLRIYESGVGVSTYGSWTVGMLLEITYSFNGIDWVIRYLKDRVVQRTVAVSAGQTFYFDSSFYTQTPAAALDDIQFAGELVASGGMSLVGQGTRVGQVVFNTADKKLYGWTGTYWNAEVSSTYDITGQINTTQIEDSAINSAKIGAAAVIAGKIAANAVGSTEIAALAVLTSHIADVNVTTAKIADAAVAAGKIAANAVGSTEIAAAAVIEAKIATEAVSTTKIAALSITAAKIAAGAITAEKLTVGTVQNSAILNGSFEDADSVDATLPASWARSIVYGGTSTTSRRTTANFKSGAAALELNPGAGASADMRAKKVPVVPGEQWYMSAQAVRFGSGNSSLYFRLIGGATEATDTQYSNGVEGVNVGSGTWTKYEGTFTVPASVYWLAPFFLNYQDNTGAGLYIDDVIFQKVVISAVIADGSIITNKLAANAVTAGKIAADTITATEIAAGAITASELAALSVTTAKLDANAVTAAKIAALTITAAEIASATITGGKLVADTITATQIAAGAVTSSELATDSVVAGKIAAGTIVAADIAALTITGAKIAAATITAAKMVADTITAGEIAAGAISTSELATDAVTAVKIAAGVIATSHMTANTIDGDRIAAGTINANKITAGTITADRIVVNSLFDRCWMVDATGHTTTSGTGASFDWALTTEVYDNLDMHQSGFLAAISLLNSGGGGLSIITAKVGWDSNSTGVRKLGINANYGGTFYEVVQPAAAVSGADQFITCFDENPASDQWYRVNVYQDSGANRTVTYKEFKVIRMKL